MESFMKKTTLLLGVLCFSVVAASPFGALAETQENTNEPTQEPSTLKANFRRLGLELSSTQVKHSDQYQNSSISALNADSQTVVKGVFDFVMEYGKGDIHWDNSVFAEYAKTKLKPSDGPTDTNETADKILLSTNYTHKMFSPCDASVGPFADLAYQTEFTKNNDSPRAKIFRGMLGLKLFDGVVFKDLYAGFVQEYDMTYDPNIYKLGAQIGWRIEKPLREGVQFSADGYYRHFFSYSHYIGEDLKYDFNITGRMDVKITDVLTLGPYLSYRRARSRQASADGSNFMIGLAFGYSDIFDLFK